MKEYTKAKEINEEKLRMLDEKISNVSSTPKKESGEKEEEPTAKKHTKAAMLAELKQRYENGEITKKGYDSAKKIIIRK